MSLETIPSSEIQTAKKSVVHEVYDCGCWFYRESLGGETLVLKMEVCSLCMQLQWGELEALDKGAELTLDLPS